MHILSPLKLTKAEKEMVLEMLHHYFPGYDKISTRFIIGDLVDLKVNDAKDNRSANIKRKDIIHWFELLVEYIAPIQRKQGRKPTFTPYKDLIKTVYSFYEENKNKTYPQ